MNRPAYSSSLQIIKGSDCDKIKFDRSGLVIGFILEMEESRPTYSAGDQIASFVPEVFSSVNDSERSVRLDGNKCVLQGELKGENNKPTGVSFLIELENNEVSSIGKVKLFGRNEHDDRPVRLRFFEVEPYDCVLEYNNDFTCYPAPYSETPLVIWRRGDDALMTCFGNGNIEPYSFQDRVHSAVYYHSEFEFLLAEYDFQYKVPPLVYNTLIQESGGMLDQDASLQRLPFDYRGKLDALKGIGVKHVILHSPWQKLHGLWEPNDPELYWSLIDYAQSIGLKVLAYWNPNAFETPHSFDDDILFTWPGYGPDWGKSLRMVDIGRPGGASLARKSLHDWLKLNSRLDGIYIDLFWAFGDRSTGIIQHSFPEVERFSRECMDVLSAWKSDFVLMFNARYYGPPSMFHYGTPLFGEWTNVEDEIVNSGRIFGGANMWPVIGLGDDAVGLQCIPINNENLMKYRNDLILHGAVPYIQERLYDCPSYYSYFKYLADIDENNADFSRNHNAVVAPDLDVSVYDTRDKTVVFIVNNSMSRVSSELCLDTQAVSSYTRKIASVSEIDAQNGVHLDISGSKITKLPVELDPLHVMVISLC